MNISSFLDNTTRATINTTGITINMYLWTNESSTPINWEATIVNTESIPLNWNPPNPKTTNATIDIA